MKNIFSSQRFDQSYDEYNNAVEWIRSLGLRIASSRIEEYEDIHHRLLRLFEQKKFDEAKKLIPKTFNALYEINNLSSIYIGLAGKYDEQIKEKLAKVVKGVVNSKDETEKTTISRNIQFELYLASKFAQAGYQLIFDNTSDIKFICGNKVVLIECKRLSSGKKVGKNIKYAKKQLERQYSKSNYRGMIAVDITKLVNESNDILEKNSEDDISKVLSKIIDSFISDYDSIWQRSKWRKKTISLIIRYSMMGVIKDRNDMMTYCHQTAFTPITRAGRFNYAFVEQITNSLS